MKANSDLSLLNKSVLLVWLGHAGRMIEAARSVIKPDKICAVVIDLGQTVL